MSRLTLAPLLAFSFISTLSFSASGEEALTLAAILSKVGESPRLQRSNSVAEEAGWKKTEGLSTLLPTFTFGANRLLEKKYMLTDITLGNSPTPTSIPQILPTTTYSVAAQWTIFDGWANVERYQASRSLETAAKSEHSWAQFQTKREAVLLFYRAVAAESLKTVAEQNVKTLEEHFRDVENFRKSGMNTKYDVLRVDVQASEARSELLNATDNTAVTRLRLGELLGQDLAQATLGGTLPALGPEAIAGLQTGDLKAVSMKRADLAALSERIEASHKMANAADKYWVPKVSLNAQFQNYNNRDDSWERDKFRDAYTVGVQAAWTFDGVIGSYARDRQATEQAYQAEKTLEINRLKASNDIEASKRRYLYFCNVFKARQNDIGKAEESVRLAKEGRRAGVRTNTDLLDAELELFRARAGLVNAQIGAIESIINLELASGQELYKF